MIGRDAKCFGLIRDNEARGLECKAANRADLEVPGGTFQAMATTNLFASAGPRLARLLVMVPPKSLIPGWSQCWYCMTPTDANWSATGAAVCSISHQRKTLS